MSKNNLMLLKGVSFVFQLQDKTGWTATLSAMCRYVSFNSLYVVHEGQELHVRHFFNRYLANKAFTELERQVFRSQSTEDLLAYCFIGKESIKTILEWPATRIVGYVTGVPPITIPKVPVINTFDLFYKACMEEPCPSISTDLRDKERATLQSFHGAVTVKSLCGSLNATLELDGTFSLSLDEDVTMMGLNSFELLWYLKQDGLKRRAPGTIRLLQPALIADPHFALRHIFTGDLSLYAALDVYADMPPLIPVDDVRPTLGYQAVLDRLRSKKAVLEADYALLQEAIRMQEEIRATKASIETLMSQLVE
jgi:hypothetical protein